MKKKTAPAAAKRRKSRFEIGVAELRTRVAGADLPKGPRAVLLHALKHAREGDVAQWVDVPFAKLDRKELRAADPARTVAMVFTKPFVTKDALLLTDSYLGGRAQRDGMAYLFLEEVRARDVCSVPETLAIFAKGLVVKRLASFDSPDGHAEVAGRLVAPYVVSNVSGGGLYLAPGTAVEIGAYARFVKGLPRGTTTVKHDTLREMLPFLDEDAEDVDAWELMLELVETGKPFPTMKQAAAAAKAKAKLPSVRGKTFAFAGKIAFAYATMKTAKDCVTHGGGKVASTVTPEVDYLVIGDVKSALLGEGPKTELHRKAEALNAKGARIAIVREDVFWDLKK